MSHASRLRQRAAEAVAKGQFDYAHELLDDAELLARDVADFTDELEEHQIDELLMQVQQARFEIDPISGQGPSKARWTSPGGKLGRIGAGVGAGLAVGCMVAEL
ncbi:MAG: hypothetical protein AAF941_03010 [Pseudomonadota bacterium]